MDPHPASGPREGTLDSLEAQLHDLLSALPTQPPAARGPGAPPVLSASFFWAGLLVCVLRGFSTQSSLWQLVRLHGLWDYPRVSISRQAVYDRLARAPAAHLLGWFQQITALLQERFAAVNDLPFARFATAVLALDHCTLDAVLRKLQLFRDLPRTAPCLLPGQLATLFDLRRQLFYRVEFWEDAQRNEKHDVEHWLEWIPEGALLLFDLGFFAFRWFDTLTSRGIYFVSRQRAKVTFQLYCRLYDGPAGPVRLRESLVYLGAHRADRAAHPLRLIEIFTAKATFCYLTNVLDPALLPAAHVVQLYRRRWDIETAFKLLKSQLNLFLLWSGQQNVVKIQVFATLLLAQVVLGVRNEIAQLANASLREVSLPLMIRWIPELARRGDDPVSTIATHGHGVGLIIRPFRGRAYDLPRVSPDNYAQPLERPPPRKPRYAGKQGTHSPHRQGIRQAARKHAWGVRQRQPRTT